MLPRLSDMQLRFAKAHARTGDPIYAAWIAGYANPVNSGSTLKKNQAVMEHSRGLTQRFLFDKAGALAVEVLVELASPGKQDGIRFKAAAKLADMANIAITDLAAEKPPSELTAGELGALVEDMRNELHKQRELAAKALASLPTAIVEHESIFD